MSRCLNRCVSIFDTCAWILKICHYIEHNHICQLLNVLWFLFRRNQLITELLNVVQMIIHITKTNFVGSTMEWDIWRRFYRIFFLEFFHLWLVSIKSNNARSILGTMNTETDDDEIDNDVSVNVYRVDDCCYLLKKK